MSAVNGKVLRCIAVLGLVSVSMRLIASDVDHLIPSHRQREPQYYSLLSSLLGLTGFDCGRTIVVPAFEPEYSVSVYTRSGAGASTYGVTYVIAETNVWQRTNEGRDRTAVPKVRRFDAEIPEQTAHLLREIWMGMLTGPQRPRPTPTPRREIVISDETSVELSLQRWGSPMLFGEIDNISVRPPGKKKQELVRLSWLLVEYCKTNPKQRPAIVKRIDDKANALLALLK